MKSRPPEDVLVDCGGGVRLERGVRCVLRDGVTLVSDHYYPPEFGKRPHPTLLMRQPYGRDIASTVVYNHPAWFARHGYNVVIQDVRGRGDSEGEFYPFRHEAADGFDTVNWVAERPECDGRVGMYGFSYQGMTQLLAAVENPPALRCIAPAMVAADLHRGWFYQNGALRLAATLGWGVQMLRGDARRRRLREASDALEAARDLPYHLPYQDLPALRPAELPTYVRDWIAHREPGEFWEALDVSARYDLIRVPALHVTGWYDLYAQGSLDGYAALRAGAGDAAARDGQYLVAGPWVHIPWGNQVGDWDLGDAANCDTDRILLRWFDHWLKDAGTWEAEPRTRVFVLGANRWETADEFPATGKNPPAAVFHLRSEGNANSRRGDGSLDPEAAGGPPDLFVYDPEVPVFAPGGPTAAPGAFDQSRLELGNNLLVYTSAPLTAPLEVRGQPRLVLFAATSAAPTDLTGKLVKVDPAGKATFLCLGYARSSALFGDAQYRPDAVHRWEFALDATACRFQAGERVRLEVASSAFPLFDRHPNSAEIPPSQATSWHWRRSTQTVFHDAAYPSSLTLPLAA